MRKGDVLEVIVHLPRPVAGVGYWPQPAELVRVVGTRAAAPGGRRERLVLLVPASEPQKDGEQYGASRYPMSAVEQGCRPVVKER